MNPIDPEQTASVFVDGMKRATPLRAQALQYVDDAHQAQQAGLAFEANRIANRYGADSAQSKAISARIAAHAARGAVIASERQRAQIQTPQTLPDALIIYGRALDASGAGLKAVEISAIIANGAPVAATKSSGDGSFVLAVPTTTTVTSATKYERKAAGKGAASTKRAPAASTARAEKISTNVGPTPVTSVRLVFTDRRSATAYRDPEVFQVKGSSLAYREITMPIAAK
jgi:hypothetical protein